MNGQNVSPNTPLRSLSTRAQAVLSVTSGRISQNTFDSIDVERFLIYGRQYFPTGSWLRDFADTVAHSIRNRGNAYRTARCIANLPVEALLDSNNRQPAGESGIENETLLQELNSLFSELGHNSVGIETAEDFMLCLILLSNATQFEHNGTPQSNHVARTIIIKNQIALDVGVEGRAAIVFAAVPNRYMELQDKYSLVIPGAAYVEAIRNKCGRLELVFYSEPEICNGALSVHYAAVPPSS